MKTAIAIVGNKDYNLAIDYETRAEARLAIDMQIRLYNENIIAVLWDVKK